MNKKNDASENKDSDMPKSAPVKKYRYSCHGCTNNAGWFQEPGLNIIVICPRCGMEQLTKLENFIYEA